MVYFAVTAQSFKIARSKIINVWKRWNKPPISHIPILIQPKPFNKLFEPPTKYSFFFLFHILLLRAFLWLTIDQHNSSVAITLRKFLILFNKIITIHYTLSRYPAHLFNQNYTQKRLLKFISYLIVSQPF